MGEAADDIIDGLVCQECGEFFEDFEAVGYPRSCGRCSKNRKSDFEDYGKQQRGGYQARAAKCVANFREAADLATAHGMTLKRHTAEHYQLVRHKPEKAIWNLYPRSSKASPRVWTESRFKGTNLKLQGKKWTLLDAVKAAVELTAGQAKPKAAAQ